MKNGKELRKNTKKYLDKSKLYGITYYKHKIVWCFPKGLSEFTVFSAIALSSGLIRD
jgi:hypothetical protein